MFWLCKEEDVDLLLYWQPSDLASAEQGIHEEWQICYEIDVDGEFVAKIKDLVYSHIKYAHVQHTWLQKIQMSESHTVPDNIIDNEMQIYSLGTYVLF